MPFNSINKITRDELSTELQGIIDDAVSSADMLDKFTSRSITIPAKHWSTNGADHVDGSIGSNAYKIAISNPSDNKAIVVAPSTLANPASDESNKDEIAHANFKTIIHKENGTTYLVIITNSKLPEKDIYIDLIEIPLNEFGS